MNYIGKILPVDGYIARLRDSLPVDYTASLTHLYQPLIGLYAVMLYQTLLEESRLHVDNTLQTHHTLMTYMNIPLDDIYRTRLKLEGIGLLQTYRLEDDETGYLYELHPPFSPKFFFSDAMLSQLLFHHVGSERFQHLQKHFTDREAMKKETNITASFQDVFQTFAPVSDLSETAASIEPSAEPPLMGTVDFSWLQQVLQQRMIPVKKVLTVNNKKLIIQMLSLYDLPQHDVEKAMLWSLTEHNSLDAEAFKSACHDLFKASYPSASVQLAEKQSHEPKTEQADKVPETKEEQLIQRMETMSPKQLLEDFSSGRQASDQDMKIIREVMTKQGLSAPVMNVLIHYVLLKSNMKLSRNYLEKIASHWSRSKLTNAREAMKFAKQQLNQPDAKQNKQTFYQKKQHQEVVPDWFKDRKKKKQPSTTVDQSSQTGNTEDKEDLAELLRTFTQDSSN